MEKAKCKVMRPDFEVLTGGTEKEWCMCEVFWGRKLRIDRGQINISQGNKEKAFSCGSLAKN